MKVFAHRGASGEFTENTLLAFKQAILQNCDGIELDVQYHHSGELFLLHDRFVTTNNGDSVFFDDLSSQEISQITLDNNQNIATLTNALSTISGQCLVNIEIKTADDCSEKITDLMAKLKHDILFAINHHHFVEADFVLSSFNHKLLQMITKTMPNIKTAALIASLPINISTYTSNLSISAINPCVDCLNGSFIKSAHNNNVEVNVYTVDQAHDIKQCLIWGVDAIFTNYPKRSRDVIDSLLILKK